MKRHLRMVMGLVLALGLSTVARAAVSDALTVTITPNAFYAVDIDTTSVALNLGSVNLSASTQTVSPATVTVQSTFLTTDIRLQGSISSSGTDWSFDADTSSTESDALAAWATFTSVSRSSAPAQDANHFVGTIPGNASSDVISTTNRYVGSSAGDSTTDLFENGAGFATVEMDSQAPSAQSHLWLYFRMPSASTESNPQNINIVLTAVAPN